MSDQFIILLGTVLCLIGLWTATLLYTLWDTRWMKPSASIRWLAVVLFLPLIGFVIYLRRRKGQATPRRGETQVKYAPVGPIEARDPHETQPTLPGLAVRPSGPAPRGATVLLVEDGPHEGASFVLSHLPARIGRSADCAIRLEQDLSVSRQHAEFYRDGGALYVRDLESTHGTRVNGFRVTEFAVQPGDRIEVGQSRLTVETGGSPG